MNNSPLASFRPNFDLPWRGAPPIEAVNNQKRPKQRKGKPPWSPSATSPTRAQSPPIRKRVTFSTLPPRPSSSSLKRNSKSPTKNIRNRRKSKSRSKSKSKSKLLTLSQQKRSLLHLHQHHSSNKYNTTTKAIAPYWMKSNTDEQGPSSPTSLTLHPNQYLPAPYTANDLQILLDQQSKKRNRILGHEMLDAAMRGDVTKVRLAIEIDGNDPDYVDPDLWGDTSLIR